MVLLSQVKPSLSLYRKDVNNHGCTWERPKECTGILKSFHGLICNLKWTQEMEIMQGLWLVVYESKAEWTKSSPHLAPPRAMKANGSKAYAKLMQLTTSQQLACCNLSELPTSAKLAKKIAQYFINFISKDWMHYAIEILRITIKIESRLKMCRGSTGDSYP